MERKNMFSTTEAARLIGVKVHQLKYAIENGSIPDASATFVGKRVFTEHDIERMKEYFDEKKGGNDEV